MRVVLLASVLLLAGCFGGAKDEHGGETEAGPWTWPALPEANPQPIAAGPMTWSQQDYDFGTILVGGDGAKHEEYEYEATLRGVFTIPDGEGPFPLAVFLHGQHTTCAGPDGSEGGDCSQPYRNDMGYVYLMEFLASHGIATASALAHEINNENGGDEIGMWARGELVLATIAAFNESEFAPRLDFERLGLMGHSRGGEGVVTAVAVNQAWGQPFNLSAVIALAPTDFAYRAVPDIPFLTLAPYCDGDVYNLHGLRQFDQSRFVDNRTVKVQLLVMGANHNNYNTMWGRGWTDAITSDGDDADFGDTYHPHCDLRREDGGGRLSLEDTYNEAKLHLGGFLRWTLLGDSSLAPYFLDEPVPAAACPDQSAPCDDAVHVSARTPGRRDLFWVESSGWMGPADVIVPGGDAAACRMSDCAYNVYTSAHMADVPLLPAQQSTGYTKLRFEFVVPTDLRETPILNIRLAVPSDGKLNIGPPTLRIEVATVGGLVSIPTYDPDLFLPPSLPFDPAVQGGRIGGAKVSANAIEIPLSDPVDLQNVTSVELLLGTAQVSFLGGQPIDRILVADAWFNRDTSAAMVPLDAWE